MQKFGEEACLIDHLKDGDNGGKIKTGSRKAVGCKWPMIEPGALR